MDPASLEDVKWCEDLGLRRLNTGAAAAGSAEPLRVADRLLQKARWCLSAAAGW